MIHTDGRPTIVSDSRENREFAAADDRKTVEAAESITAQAVEVPPHLRGSISPEEWTQICKEDFERAQKSARKFLADNPDAALADDMPKGKAPRE
jgi:hypothetical protein